MNLFITLLENVNKSRTSANNVSLILSTQVQNTNGGLTSILFLRVQV
jgi:hypothetical protein